MTHSLSPHLERPSIERGIASGVVRPSNPGVFGFKCLSAYQLAEKIRVMQLWWRRRNKYVKIDSPPVPLLDRGQYKLRKPWANVHKAESKSEAVNIVPVRHRRDPPLLPSLSYFASSCIPDCRIVGW